MTTIYRHPPMTCPQCGKLLDALSQGGGIIEQRPPEPGDLTVCLDCRAILEITALWGLRVVTPSELAALDPDEQIDLEATQAHLDLYASWRRTREGSP